jgi:hypothetical protein
MVFGSSLNIFERAQLHLHRRASTSIAAHTSDHKYICTHERVYVHKYGRAHEQVQVAHTIKYKYSSTFAHTSK